MATDEAATTAEDEAYAAAAVAETEATDAMEA
jgi:hypothetical protein